MALALLEEPLMRSRAKQPLRCHVVKREAKDL